MMVRLHKNATTTPATRRYIQSSNLPVRRLARELGVSEDTIRRWKKRTDVEDRPHTAHRLQTNLTPFHVRPGQGVVVLVQQLGNGGGVVGHGVSLGLAVRTAWTRACSAGSTSCWNQGLRTSQRLLRGLG